MVVDGGKRDYYPIYYGDEESGSVPHQYYPIVWAFLNGYAQLRTEVNNLTGQPLLEDDTIIFISNLFEQFFEQALELHDEEPDSLGVYISQLHLLSYFLLFGYIPQKKTNWENVYENCMTYRFILTKPEALRLKSYRDVLIPNPCQFRESCT